MQAFDRKKKKENVRICKNREKNSWGIDNRVPAFRTIRKVVWNFNKKCPWYSTAARLFRLKTKTSCIAEFWPKQRHQMPSRKSSTRGCERRWPLPPPANSATSWTPDHGGFPAQLTPMLQPLHMLATMQLHKKIEPTFARTTPGNKTALPWKDLSTGQLTMA